MKILIISLLTSATCFLAGAELTPSQIEARRSLEETAQMEAYGGSIYAHAKADGIDYRPILRSAIGLDQKALISLFAMKFMGEGGETHAANLKDLMKLWGDDPFAKVVARQPAEIRDLVVSNIDYAWADPEWNLYPKTLATSPDSITQRPEAEQGGTGKPATRSEPKAERGDKPQPEAEGRTR
jgi:hypothetical protein